MGGDSFVHLHVHTEYSMLDGAARLDDLFSETARLEMPAVAMTDHGNLYGAYDFWKRGRAAGVTPIIGLEGYYAPQGRRERRPFDFGGGYDEGSAEDPTAGKGRQNYTHMTLLAETTEGMHNLFRLSSLASLEGYYYKPRFDRELLETYGKGLIATTGCPSGEVNRWLQAGNYDRALAAAADFRDILGPGNFFCEVMDHGLGIERRHREDLLRIATALDLPVLATNDLHYVYPSDADMHDVLLCIGTRTTMDDPNRFRFDGRDFYLKSPAEMRNVWRDLPEACDNTLLVAERCRVEFAEGANLMPQFPIPEGESEQSWLVKEVEKGLAARFAPNPVPQAHRDQAAYEVGVVCQMGFPGYFLVVADLVRHAKEEGIRVGPGRGSAAGALIAWALGITELDPIKHGLLFERFLNPERVSMPDIDMDFDDRRRADMIRYATEKYGEERVAQIITYGSIKAKAAIKDSARALGLPYALSDRITKAMPPAVMGKDIPLSGVFDPNHPRHAEAADFRALYEAEPDVRRVVDTARGLEGLKRQPGVHAAGVILCREPLIDVIPVWRREQDGAVITQFDMGACESLGLLKMDFLGLRNLTVLDDCLRHIERNRGETIVLEELPLDGRAHLRAAGAGRHPRRLPARRRADARAAARHGPRLLRGHLRGARALPTRPDGRQGAHRVRRPQEQPQAGRPDPPGARRAAGRHPGRHVRADRLPGAGHGDRPAARGLLAGQRRPAAAGHGQEEEGDPRQGVRAVPRRHAGQRVLRGRRQDALGHPGPVLRLRVQQGPHRRVRAGVVLDGVPEGQLPGRVHGRAAHLGGRRQGQVRGLPQRVPAHGHQGAPARRQRVRGRLRAGRVRHPVRPDRDPERRQQRRGLGPVDPTVEGEVRRLHRLPGARSTPSSATSAPSSR